MGVHVVGVRHHFLHHAAHVGVVDDVEDPVSLAAAAHQPGQAELGEMLRDRGGLRARPSRPAR